MEQAVTGKSFLAEHVAPIPEPPQGTDISMQPLGPTNYTGSDTTICNYKLADRVQTSTTKAQSSSRSAKEECEQEEVTHTLLSC